MKELIRFDNSHIGIVEHDIAPPMATAITIPTSVRALIVYVAVSPFCSEAEKDEARKALTQTARLIARSPQLYLAGNAAWHMCQSGLAMASGSPIRTAEITEDLLREVSQALEDVLFAIQGRSGSGKEPTGSVPEAPTEI